jgi:5-methylcytosine-specific restriction endonuclease McrA
MKKRDRSHRKPPRPPFWTTAQGGECKFCGEPVLKEDGTPNRRLRWHRACSRVWRFANDRFYARQVVRARDKGLCVECGKQCAEDEWEADHDKPLILAEGDLAFFLPGNVVTRCIPCHRRKSAAEQKLSPGTK